MFNPSYWRNAFRRRNKYKRLKNVDDIVNEYDLPRHGETYIKYPQPDYKEGNGIKVNKKKHKKKKRKAKGKPKPKSKAKPKRKAKRKNGSGNSRNV